MVTWYLLVSRMSRHQPSRPHGRIMSFSVSQRMIGQPMSTGSGLNSSMFIAAGRFKTPARRWRRHLNKAGQGLPRRCENQPWGRPLYVTACQLQFCV
jgi:hypothetical protein